ncbi:MAG: hypothetical protein ACQKBY_04640 [Verrucomicrobiales bacterium]
MPFFGVAVFVSAAGLASALLMIGGKEDRLNGSLHLSNFLLISRPTSKLECELRQAEPARALPSGHRFT